MCFEWKQIEMFRSDPETNNNGSSDRADLSWSDSDSLSPCQSCHSVKCDGIFYSKTMQILRSVVAFLPFVSCWLFSLLIHFPLLLHCFYSNLHRVQADISFFILERNSFISTYILMLILNEATNSHNDLLIAFWKHSLCSTITSLVL